MPRLIGIFCYLVAYFWLLIVLYRRYGIGKEGLNFDAPKNICPLLCKIFLFVLLFIVSGCVIFGYKSASYAEEQTRSLFESFLPFTYYDGTSSSATRKVNVIGVPEVVDQNMVEKQVLIARKAGWHAGVLNFLTFQIEEFSANSFADAINQETFNKSSTPSTNTSSTSSTSSTNTSSTPSNHTMLLTILIIISPILMYLLYCCIKGFKQGWDSR